MDLRGPPADGLFPAASGCDCLIYPYTFIGCHLYSHPTHTNRYPDSNSYTDPNTNAGTDGLSRTATGLHTYRGQRLDH